MFGVGDKPIGGGMAFQNPMVATTQRQGFKLK